jgi:hypothetical protein
VAEVMHEVEVEEDQGYSLLDAVEGPESAA